MATRHRITLPELGESLDRVVVVEWHVAEGDEVTAGDPLLIVETDKVDTDVPAPISGVVSELLAPVGAELEVDDPICIIEG